jgi:hypothetical protein
MRDWERDIATLHSIDKPIADRLYGQLVSMTAKISDLERNLRATHVALKACRTLDKLEKNIDEHGVLRLASGSIEDDFKDRVAWVAARIRNYAKDLEDRYRPLDEEVPKTK